MYGALGESWSAERLAHTALGCAPEGKCHLRSSSWSSAGFADFVGDSDWEEDIEDLLREAAAAAGWSSFEAKGGLVREACCDASKESHA